MDQDRRQFIRKAAAFLAAWAAPVRLWAADQAPMPARTLGRTGARVSALGYGAMQCSDPDTIRLGLESGITYVDTADCYMGGRNERIVGRAMDGMREKVFVATKVHIGNEPRMRSSVERSRASLGVQTVDLMQIHGVSSPIQVGDKGVQRIMEAMKGDGLFRFAGVTTHSNQEQVVRAVTGDGYYDTVLVAVNFRSPDSLFRAIEDAARAGVGIIAMKTQNGGFRDQGLPGLNPHQAALRRVLEMPGIATAVPGMLTRDMVRENVAAVTGAGGLADTLTLELYRAQLTGRACAFCSTCLEQCPEGTGGLDAVRIATYGRGYGDGRLAREMAAEVAGALRACAACPGCVVRCSQGINIALAAKEALGFLDG
ncbi:MAG: aldo/keto reductase [bacterium]|nr:MAG: aldo/keto reductase [bacterium]